MAESQTRQFLDFEKPIKELFDQIEQLKQTAEKNKIDLSESINQLHEKIEEQALSATRADTESAKIIVAFSGLDVQKLQELRELGIAAPAVNLCQFVDNLEGLTHTSLSTQINAGDVIVGAALQFGFSGGSSTCNICEAKDHGNMNYWISIADTCSRFAQSVQKMRS